MKRRAWLLVLLVVLSCTVLALADTGTVTIPASTTTIEAEAFRGVSNVTTVRIPDTVTSIGSMAFADCSGLEAVYLPSGEVSIAPDAFQNSPDVVLYVHDQSPAYVYALANGCDYELVGSAVSFIARTAELTAESGKPSGALQNDMFALKRLIVRMESSGTKLPPIAQFNPSAIVYDGSDLYVLQFSTASDANRCNAYLETAEGVLYVTEDRYLYSDITSAELSAAGLSNAWNDGDPMGFAAYSAYVKENYSGSVTVAVIDTGVGYNAGLDSRVRSDGYDFITSTPGARYDPVGHGTQIAALILELVGQNNVNILPIRAFDADGQPTVLALGNAITYARSKGASIINLSSNFDYDGHLAYVIRSCGATVIVAAGNQNKDCSNVFPANISSVITVGGVAPNGSGGIVRWKDSESSGSNYGSYIDYAAPATGVIAGSGYSEAHGTSFAAPHIAAAYALLTLDKEHDAADMRQTATEIPNAQLGAGMPVLSQLATEYVVSIKLGTPPDAVMGVNQYYAGLLKVTPDDATDPSLSVATSDASIMTASITDDGILVLTALKPGNVDVTVTANDGGGAKLTLNITVKQQVTSIKVSSESNGVLYMDSTCQLITQILPATAERKDIVWSVSPEGAAEVTTEGLVKPLQEGEVTITATAADGFGASGSITLNIVARPAPESVTINSDHLTLNVGESIALTASVSPSEADQTITWSSSDTAIATIDADTGVLQARSVGFSIIEAEAANGKHDSIIVTVIQKPESISIDGVSTLNVGESAILTATLLPANANDKTVTWSSNDESVATVNAATGEVTALSRGSVTITATSNADQSVKAGWGMTILQPVTSVSITGTTTMTEGTTARLTATVRPDNANDPSLTWSSSDSTVAKVDAGGVVTAVAPGTAVITATAKDGSGVASNQLTITVKLSTFTVTFNANGGSCSTSSITATRTVALGTLPTPTRANYNFDGWYTAASGGTKVTSSTVYNVASDVTLYAHWNPVLVSSIKISGATTLTEGTTTTLSASVAPTNALNPAITWASSNTAVAKVDAGGVVTAVAPGTAVITATAKDGSGVASNQLTITVKLSTFKVTFNANGGSCSTSSITATRTVALGTLPTPTRANYNFDGWYTAASGGTKVTSSTVYNVASDVTLYAHWSGKPYTITFQGHNTSTTMTCYVDTAIGTLPTASRSEYTFTGWFMDSGTQLTETYQQSTPTNFTVTAKFTPKPYTLTLNANGGQCSVESLSCYVDTPIGTLPTPTRDYYTFLGWYTIGGQHVTRDFCMPIAQDGAIIAKWELNPEKGPVLESAVPADAQVTQSLWSYREHMETHETSVDSIWTPNGSWWQEVGSGSAEYANFPSGEYNTKGYGSYASKDKYYTAMMHEPYTASETETTKREVTNTHAGWIYWHWAYNAQYNATANRIIAYKPGTYGDAEYVYGYWYSIKSTVECPKAKSSYNTIGQYPANGRTTYDCTELINNTSYVPASHKTTSSSGLCTWRFYRLEYFTSAYVDYQKVFMYYRDLELQTTDPGDGQNITDKVKYVMYREK